MVQSGGGGVAAPGVLYRKKCTLVAVASELKESTLVAGGWLRSRGLCLDEVPLVGAVPERVNAAGGGVAGAGLGHAKGAARRHLPKEAAP